MHLNQPPPVRRVSGTELDPRDLYRLLRLRVEVFVVEQECPYPELDGRDLETSTRHLWVAGASPVGCAAPDAAPLAYLRLVRDPDGTWRIGRVCTARSVRGRGLARGLMHAALAEIGDEPAVLSAQTYATGFYTAFGFEPVGAEYVEDGIPHVDMALPR